MEPFLAAANEAVVVNPLPVDPLVYGFAIFAALMFLLMAIMSLRSVALRQEPPTKSDVAQPNQGSTSSNS